VLDHLLLLLDGGTLMVLKYSQLVQRFYIAAELQLAAGGPDHLTRLPAFKHSNAVASVDFCVASCLPTGKGGNVQGFPC
jgi:hypothetical protein